MGALGQLWPMTKFGRSGDPKMRVIKSWACTMKKGPNLASDLIWPIPQWGPYYMYCINVNVFMCTCSTQLIRALLQCSVRCMGTLTDRAL